MKSWKERRWIDVPALKVEAKVVSSPGLTRRSILLAK